MGIFRTRPAQITAHAECLAAALALIAALGCSASTPTAENSDRGDSDGATSATDAGKHRDTGVNSEESSETLDGGASSEHLRNCGPANCAGCCTGGGACMDGLVDTRCGRGGDTCTDCTQIGSVCESTGTCCIAECDNKICGAANGCEGTCAPGSGCCPPQCQEKTCGDPDDCGGTCEEGSGCVVPCVPHCEPGGACGDGDGCWGTCPGTCDTGSFCNAVNECECGPAPDYVLWAGTCMPSCSAFLHERGLAIGQQGVCCVNGCRTPGWRTANVTYDCMQVCCVPTSDGPTCPWDTN